MSGGSYNYLCMKEVSELFSVEPEIESMAKRLQGLGYASDAARETTDIISQMRSYERILAVRLERLQSIWHAVEWWDSFDTDENSLIKELALYREETKAKEIFTKDQIEHAIKAFLEFGEQSFDKCHKGYFSGDGFAARALRFHFNETSKR